MIGANEVEAGYAFGVGNI